jgi:Na+-transporting NADH:ubiquinone oxidoreductase subunit NqrB
MNLRNLVTVPVLSKIEDARWFQILFLGTFLFYGLFALGWRNEASNFIWILTAAVVSQLTLAYISGLPPRSVLSAVITAFGTCLLLKANSPITLALAVSLGILSKFTLRWNGKHFFNPANFGIIAALLLTNDAWVSPGQWGHNTITVFLFAALGFLVVGKVGRMDTSIAFLLSFGGLMFLRDVVYLGWEVDVWLHKMSNGSLLLFTFFMITDPRSIPNHRVARVVWSVAIGAVAFYLSSKMYVHTAIVWVLFFASPLTPVLDFLFKGDRFQWIAPKLWVPNSNAKQLHQEQPS